MRCQPVGDGAHRVLPHTVLYIPAGIAPHAAGSALQVAVFHCGAFKIPGILQFCIGRRVQVGGTANESRQLLEKCLDHLPGCRTGSQPFAVRRKSCNVFIPIFRYMTMYQGTQLFCQVRVFLRIDDQLFFPFCGKPLSNVYGYTKMFFRLRRHQESRFHGPPQVFFGKLHLLFAQWGAMCGGGILFIGRAITDMRAHQYQRRAVRFRLRSTDGLVQRFKVVAVFHPQGMPAV